MQQYQNTQEGRPREFVGEEFKMQAEVQVFEDSAPENCERCGFEFWTKVSIIDYHGEIGGWKAKCGCCGHPAEILND